MARFFLPPVRAALFLAVFLSAVDAEEWTTLDSCRLVPSFLNDGDSFLVESNGERYVIRLYFVDAPEVSMAYPERVADQAAYFGRSSKDMIQLGALATAEAEKFLSGPFTLHTRFSDGGGWKKRYLAIVSRGGDLLSHHLVREGLARIHGYQTSSAWRGGLSPDRMRQELARLEEEARNAGRGGWSHLAPVHRPAPTAPPSDGYPGWDDTPRISLNHAPPAELIKVPGIGETYAKRIVDGRPWGSLNDLMQIRGIGIGKVTDWAAWLTVHPPRAEIPQLATADFYRERRQRFLGQPVVMSILGITEMEWPAPDGFAVLLAHTGTANSSGGDIPLFVPEERLEGARAFYADKTRVGRTTAILHDYQGREVLVIPRARETP